MPRNALVSDWLSVCKNFLWRLHVISVQARRNWFGQASGIWKAVPLRFPTAVRALSLHSQHSPSRLCENYTGFNRCNISHFKNCLIHQWHKIDFCCCGGLCFILQSLKMTLHINLLNHGLVRGPVEGVFLCTITVYSNSICKCWNDSP